MYCFQRLDAGVTGLLEGGGGGWSKAVRRRVAMPRVPFRGRALTNTLLPPLPPPLGGCFHS